MSLSKRSSSARKSKPAVSAPAPARVVSQVFVDMPTPSSGNGTTTTSPGSSVASTSTTPTPLFSSSSGSTTTVSTTSLLLSSGPSVFSASASNVPSTANDIAPQVFGEIPKPRPSPRKYSSPLHYYQEQEDSVQSTLVPGGNSNLPKQHLDVMPQPYGFDNLSRQSIIRADGTEKRYYALPEDYPLEQAAPPTSPSAEEKVGFTAPQFVTTAGLAPNLCFNDNATAGSDLMLVNSLQLPLVVSATPNVCKKIPVYDILVEKDSACLNLISDKPDFWLALKRQDDEWACNCPIMKAPDSSPTRSSQLSIEHSMRKLRLLWDPGATDLPIRFTTHVGATDQQGIYVYKSATVHILAGQLGARRAPILKCTTMRSGAFGLVWTTLNASALLVLVVPCSTGTYCSLPSFEIRVKLQWDPGVLIVLQSYPATPLIVTFIMQRAAHLFACQCPCSLSYNCMLKTAYCLLICLGEISVSCMSDPVEGLYSLSLTTPWDPGVLVMHSRIIIRSTRNIRDAELWSLSSPSSCQLPQSSSVKWSSFSAKHFQDSAMKKCIIFSSGYILARNPRYAILLLHYFLWGSSTERVLSKTTVPKIMDPKHVWSQLLLQYLSCCTTQNALLQVQDFSLSIVLDCLYSKAFKQLICYSSIFSSTAIYMSTARKVCIRLVLSSRKLTQAGKDDADMYQVVKTQLPMRKTTHMWDPGISSILFSYIWLHVHMIKLVDCSATHACYLVSARLHPTQIATHTSDNSELGELTSRCWVFHVHQITNRTRIAPNVIRLFEYGYTMDRLSGQWEFLHQEGF